RLLLNVAADDPTAVRHATRLRNDAIEDQTLDETVLQDARDAITDCRPISLSYEVANTNRSVGTQVSGEIAYQWGGDGIADGTVELNLSGSAGQSLGAFLSPGLRLILTGEANDYVGKSMSGGEIVIRPEPGSLFAPHQAMILGNTVMYGATGGSLFANGRAGERFCVRNSGGTAVVEGVGDHGCEYMTNGAVVILGHTGKNFGAGMTGGTAYILDLDDRFQRFYNPSLISLDRLAAPHHIAQLRELIQKHHTLTASPRAAEILSNWEKFQPLFWRVSPNVPSAKPVPEPSKEPEATGKVISEDVIASR
ncbi:MAG: glutamate synthase subunit alpha, partial [Terrimicrobiaceae bacterium]